MSELHGKNLIGNEIVAAGRETFRALDPRTGEPLDEVFHEATPQEVGGALELARSAFERYRHIGAERRAGFLERVAERLEEAGDAIVARADTETALGEPRLAGELSRTTNQLRMFAGLVRDGSWVDARIDRALPEREPAPKPDIRRMLMPIGPVVVFGASNFPLAFSVAGGDTASALAAGCPTVVKAHPAHPGTSELVAAAILAAARERGMPEGVFSLLHGASHEVGAALVRHPATTAVGFTGSLRGGRALFDLACSRPQPIPVFAEMGSVNPVFVLPGALRERGDEIAAGLSRSVTLGTGQFCTKPGLVVGLGDDFERFAATTAALLDGVPPGTMLSPALRDRYTAGVRAFGGSPGVRTLTQDASESSSTGTSPTAFATDAAGLIGNPELSEELFGPAALFVTASSPEQLADVAARLDGHLTASIHATEAELERFRELLAVLETKVGRLVFNGFPTGVEVGPAMHHGGPYPATTDVRTTSVGTAAIYRFVRPICYQGFPQSLLPPELRDRPDTKMWRTVDGTLERHTG